MDPYQGLQMGSDNASEGSVADDLGIGLPGLAVLFGLDYYADRGGYLPFTGAGEVGPGGGDRLLRTMKARAKFSGQKGFMSDADAGKIWAMQGYSPYRHATERQYQRMRRDILGMKGGYKNNPMSGLFDKAKGNLRTLHSRYGSRAANRIWGVTQVGKFARMANVVSLVTLGAELGGGLMNAINEYEPAALKTSGGPTPEFGGQYEMPVSRTAWTQRQASLQAIHQSGMQARAALGNEASFMHNG